MMLRSRRRVQAGQGRQVWGVRGRAAVGGRGDPKGRGVRPGTVGLLR